MVKLSTIISMARTGELKSLSQKDKTDEVIVNYINLALVALYGRFQLATGEAIITLRPEIPKTIYTLDSSDPDVVVDNQPMRDDEFMSVISVWNEDGTRAGLNDEKNAFSIYTVSYNQLQIPLLADNAYVSVIYRKNPELIEYDSDLNSVLVPIPIQLLEAMLHYVGYRAHGSVDGNVQAENNTHYMRYEAACQRAAELGILTADDVNSLSTQAKGFL